jgi:hypothetical protein
MIMKVLRKRHDQNKKLRRRCRMNETEFIEAIRDKDFSEGDTFWINDIKFEVVDKR